MVVSRSSRPLIADVFEKHIAGLLRLSLEPPRVNVKVLGVQTVYVVVALFYLGWFGSVFLASTSYAFASLAFPSALIVFLTLRNQLKFSGTLFALCVACLGVAFDSLAIRLGLVHVLEPVDSWMPVWLVAIWLLFAFSTANLGPRLHVPIWLATSLGFVVGPLSYKSGEYFQVLTLASPSALLVYAIFWALMFPSTVILSKRFA